MSPFAYQLINWIIEGALLIALVIGLWTLSSIPGWLLYRALSSLMPDGVRSTASRILGAIRGDEDPLRRYFNHLRELGERVLRGSTVRLILSRRHDALTAQLRKLRTDIDLRLRDMSAASEQGGGGNLITLLQNFKKDVDRALKFGEIEDGLVDKTIMYRQAKSRHQLSLFGSALMGGLNAILLYIFFSEFQTGILIPFTNLDLSIAACILFPVAEFIAGYYAELLTENDSRFNFGKSLVKALAVFALGSLEYLVFFLLFRNLLESSGIGNVPIWVVPVLAIVGPALTVIQTFIGSGAGRAKRTMNELGTEVSLKQQTADANAFVEDLPARYTKIASSANAATQAVDQFASTIAGRGEADLPVATMLGDQRAKFLAAIDSVNPSSWNAAVDANDTDRVDIVRFTWLLPILAAVALFVLTWMVSNMIIDSGMITAGPAWLPAVIALGIGLCACASGNYIYDRVGVATLRSSETRDVLFPRDQVSRWAAIALLSVVGFALIWLGFAAYKWMGVPQALFAIALLIFLSFLGSYIDLLARGIAFLLQVGVILAILAIVVLWLMVRGVVLGTLALILIALYGASVIVGWPLIELLKWLDRRRQKRAQAQLA